jgi:NADPH:quinone reductase-like Zn-dependent oxidoreductase/NAD(P)-dependent dehydrogenase (short-subunit alcohol dehydrogenase family)/acyl carrier protein
MGMGKGFLRRFAHVKASTAMRVPDEIDLVAAATIPAAFMTAHYALEDVGRLRPGEKVLIHLATGGVGLAAIQVATNIGAEIFATAGSDQKRSYLRELGIAHVMNSRTLDFANDVLRKTGGRGVDVVLNALSGPAIEKGLECLGPFGRFVEIGKRDLAEDKPIGLRSLYYNNSYSVIDLAALQTERSDILNRLLSEISARVANGSYRPLQFTTFPVSRIADAMRVLAKAQHIGKVVVTLSEEEIEVELDLSKPTVLSNNSSYLVTGGLKGFGVAVADWLSQRGAGRLLLLGRSGVVDADAQPIIDAIRDRGTEIVTAAIDVTCFEAVDDFVAKHAKSDKPLRGIVHGAAVIQDGFLAQLDRPQIENVVRPKVSGAWNLHRAVTRAAVELDFFASFSSLAQLIGSPGQANYTAANAVLNGIASFRRCRGLPSSTIAWGAISGSGFVARSAALGSYLESIGMKSIRDTEAAKSLDYLLRADDENLTFAGVDWSAVRRALPGASGNPRLKPLLLDRTGGRSRMQAELALAPRSAWEGMLKDLIKGEVAKVLKVDASAIPLNQKLSELGLDSLSSFELKNRIEGQIDINIPVAKFLQTPTVSGLASVVANAVDAMLKAEAARAASAGVGGAGSSGATDSETCRPLPRQIAAAKLSELPMTSQAAAAASQMTAHIVCNEGFEFERVASALEQLADVQEGLRLFVDRAPDGKIDLKLGNGPELEHISGNDALSPLVMETCLWRFGLSQSDGKSRLFVRTHSSAADKLSPYLALAMLVKAIRVGKVARPSVRLSSFLNERRLEENSSEQARHLAYWKELMRSVPTALPQQGRARAIAPVGLGINRGPVDYVQTEVSIPALASLPSDEQEAILIAAYCRALAKLYKTSTIVVERHDEARRDAGSDDLLGPVADSIPILLRDLDRSGQATIEAARRTIEQARRHRAMDTAAIEGALEPILRERNVALRQFGFGFIDAQNTLKIGALGVGRIPLDLSNSLNEVRLDVAARASEFVLCVGVDSEVADRNYAEALIGSFLAELTNCLSDKAPSTVMVPGNLRWTVALAAPSEELPEAKLAVRATPGVLEGVKQIPVSTLQSSLLRSLLRSDASEPYLRYWSPSRAYRIKPRLDMSRLKRALETLTNRHEALRTRFVVEDDGSIRALLENEARATIQIEHLEGRDDASVLERVAALSREIIDPFGEPLYQVTVLRCGDGSDIVHAKGHLVVADGWSLALLLEEMFQAFMGMTLAPVEMNTEDYVRYIDRTAEPDFAERRDVYLRSLYKAPAPALPKLGRIRRGRAANVDMVHAGPAGEFLTYCTRDGQERLRQRARSAGTTETSLLIAAYAQTLASRGDVDEVITTVPLAMRTEPRMNNFIGYLAGSTLLRTPAGSNIKLDQLAVSLSEQLNRSMAYAPFNHAFRDGAVHDEITKAGSYFALYWTGMLTAERFSRGAATGVFEHLGHGGELDFGMFKIGAVETPHADQGSGACDLDVRSFHGPSGIGYRCAYDKESFEVEEAKDIFGEVVDRLQLGHDGVGSIE